MNFNHFQRALWIVCEKGSCLYSMVWEGLSEIAMEDNDLVSFESTSIKKKHATKRELSSILEEKNFTSFEVRGSKFTLSYGQSGPNAYDYFFVESQTEILTPVCVDRLIVEGLADDASFTQAHLIDTRYQHLQNIFDPLQFKALGISTDGLAMKSNGLPFPLERRIIDTDRNPGRYRLRHEYIEAVAGFMWFGHRFWQVVGNDPSTAKQILGDGTILLFDRCWKLSSDVGVFVDGHSGQIQENIRNALYQARG